MNCLKIALIISLLNLFCECKVSAKAIDTLTVIKGDSLELFCQGVQTNEVEWQLRDNYFSMWTSIPANKTNPTKFIINENRSRVMIRARCKKADSCYYYSETIALNILPNRSLLKKGDYYQGGYIYHIDGSKLFIAAPRQEWQEGFYGVWGCSNQFIQDVDKQEIGFGKANTEKILSSCKIDMQAVNICDTTTINGFEDWYLPSLKELEAIYQCVFYKTNIGYPEGWYWSSSQLNLNYALFYSCYAVNPTIRNIEKNYPMYFIPCRDIDTSRAVNQKVVFNGADSSRGNDIELIQDTVIQNRFKILLVDQVKDPNMLQWKFGVGAELISGSGQGPFNVIYNYGGFNRVSFTDESGGCTLGVKSEWFRATLFEDIKPGFQQAHRGEVNYGDVNNDTNVDVMISGSDSCHLYIQDGNGAFSVFNQEFPNLEFSYQDFGDFNNDGYVDLVLCGLKIDDTTPITEVYLNRGGKGFEKINYDFPGVSNGFAKWFDINNDGSVELIISGENNMKMPLTKIYSGFASDSIVEVQSNVRALMNSHGSFGDYDLDGDLDLVICGFDGNERWTLLYDNDEGKLTERGEKFEGVEHGQAVWADINSDGYLDIALSGAKDSIYVDSLSVTQYYAHFSKAVYYGTYLNLGNTTFSYKPIVDPTYLFYQYAFSSLDWADYDSDGDLDFVITGVPKLDYLVIFIGGPQTFRLKYPGVAHVFKNVDNLFYNIHVNIPDLPGYVPHLDSFFYNVNYDLESSSIRFLDMNKDGKPDIIREGKGWVSTIYKNVTPYINNPPGAPKNLYVHPACDHAILNWDNSNDDHSASHVLTYELAVGSEMNKWNVVSDKSHNAIQENRWKLNNLSPGKYYWCVKAIDQGLAESSFSALDSFEISPKPTKPVVTQNGNALISNVDSGNQWFDSNGPILGSDSKEFYPTTNGKYYCIVTINGCSSDTSNVIEFVIDATYSETRDKLIEMHPNPVREELFIDYKGADPNSEYVIFDVLGQPVQAGVLKHHVQRISLHEISAGIYQLAIAEGKKKWYYPIVKI